MNNLVESRILVENTSAGCEQGIDYFCENVKSFLKTLTSDYIWHKEDLLFEKSEQDDVYCLSSCTDVGENIDDEWFIVYLHYEISKHFPDMIIQLTDEDGEFLLIEAAEYLPTWLKPESSQNRVFIHTGCLHIIPYPSNPGEISKYPPTTPSYANALKLISSQYHTKATQEIQHVIKTKIADYPLKISKSFHHAHCILPKDIIYVLNKAPEMVAQAVLAFYERDPLDVKIAHEMKILGNKECATTNVKFTRHMFGQLSQANFLPDRNSTWKLPAPNNKSYKACSLGYKLTCGFEMLLSQSHQSTQNATEPSGKLWEQYLAGLNKRDFFQNELEGSKRYKELLEEAKLHFKENFSKSHRSQRSCIDQLELLLLEAQSHTDEIEKIIHDITEEDSDEWMTISPEDLDKMLGKMWANNNESQSDNLSNVISGINAFVGKISDYEGVEINDLDDDNDDDDDVNKPIKFDEAVFMNTIKNILEPNTQKMKDIDDDDDDDDNNVDSDDDDFADSQQNDHVMSELMKDMDSELYATSSLPKSFQQQTGDESDELDVDYNLIKNMLESFSSQQGLPGPVSNILQTMGMSLPLDDGT